MLHSMTDAVIVIAMLHLCGLHFCPSSILRSGFLQIFFTSDHFLVQAVCGGMIRSMKGVKMAFIPGFSWL